MLWLRGNPQRLSFRHVRNVRIASAQADFFFLFREKRHQHFTKHLRLKLTTHERNGAAVQLFHGAVAFGDDIFAHEKLVHAVTHISER